jgi:hypothetical protein
MTDRTEGVFKNAIDSIKSDIRACAKYNTSMKDGICIVYFVELQRYWKVKGIVLKQEKSMTLKGLYSIIRHQSLMHFHRALISSGSLS